MARLLKLTACSLLVFMLCVNLASSQVVLCRHPKGYDLNNLTLPDTIWEFQAKGQCILDPEITDECTFSFALCRPLPSEGNCNNSSICQASVGSDKIELGHYQMDPFESKDVNGFYAKFLKAEPIINKFTNKTCNLSVTIEFDCDKNSPWIRLGSVTLTPEPTLYTPISAEHCEVVIKLPYAGACYRIDPIVSTSTKLTTTPNNITTTPNNITTTPTIITTTTSASDEDKGLSSGSILTILFFVFLGVYLIGGALYNVFIAKEKGLFIFPHIRMWSKIFLDIVAGMTFTWKLISCQQQKKKNYEPLASTFEQENRA